MIVDILMKASPATLHSLSAGAVTVIKEIGASLLAPGMETHAHFSQRARSRSQLPHPKQNALPQRASLKRAPCSPRKLSCGGKRS